MVGGSVDWGFLWCFLFGAFLWWFLCCWESNEMDEVLSNLCGKLKLSEEEAVEVAICDAEVVVAENRGSFVLWGRL